MPTEEELDAIGISEGTDKTSLGNDYLRHYARVFAQWQNADINVLELGVGFGGSLTSWKRFFTKAMIIGVDIEERCKQYESERITVEIGSQTDITMLDRICALYPPTIIIDDGSHHADHQLISFDYLFPRLAAGGCYVVEDIFFQMLPGTRDRFVGHTGATMLAFLLEIANDRCAATLDEKVAHGMRLKFAGMVDRVEFFRGAAVVWKIPSPRDTDEHIEFALRAAEGSRARHVWDNVYRFLEGKGQGFAAVEQAARRARDSSGEHIIYHMRISELHERNGSFAEAAAELEKAFDHPHSPEWAAQAKARIADLTTRIKG